MSINSLWKQKLVTVVELAIQQYTNCRHKKANICWIVYLAGQRSADWKTSKAVLLQQLCYGAEGKIQQTASDAWRTRGKGRRAINETWSAWPLKKSFGPTLTASFTGLNVTSRPVFWGKHLRTKNNLRKTKKFDKLQEPNDFPLAGPTDETRLMRRICRKSLSPKKYKVTEF